MHGKSKLDAVPDSWLIFCVLFLYILVAKGKEMFRAGIGAKQPTYGQNVLYGGTELYGLAPYFCSSYYTVKATIRRIPYRIYGVILEIRRSATALITSLTHYSCF